MKRSLLKVALAATVSSLLYSTPAAGQSSPAARKAASVRITRGPAVEQVEPNFAIVRWESNNPGGVPAHLGIVRYGTDRKSLSQTASSPIRLNPEHSHTDFRVRLDGLEPRTTYYYTVDSTEANGTADGVKSPVNHFATP